MMEVIEKNGVEEKVNEVENNEVLDLLNRQEFVDKLIEIVELLAKNKNNSCYAINGTWGVGKSFVLDMFEKQVSVIQDEDTNTDKYLLFHYNCWDYDYYEEPLIAMVASMLDQIEEKENLLSSELKSNIKNVLKAIGKKLLIKANQRVNDEIGVDIKEICSVLSNSNTKTQEEIEEKNKYDEYFSFKKILKLLKDTVSSLSAEKTVIFVVDELDRCLPEYSIKVLERLHHLFEGIPNVQVILSIDRNQLSNTIGSIFGKGTDAKKYLEKFIRFELNIGTASFNNKFDERFKFYVDCFDYINPKTNQMDIMDFKEHIFDGIDARKSIEIIDKCHLIHNILNSDERMDYVIMCIEVAFSVLKYWGINLETQESFEGLSEVFISEIKCKNTGLHILNEKLNNEVSKCWYFSRDNLEDFITVRDIWSVILVCYLSIIGCKKYAEYYGYNYKELFDYSKKFVDLLYLID